VLRSSGVVVPSERTRGLAGVRAPLVGLTPLPAVASSAQNLQQFLVYHQLSTCCDRYEVVYGEGVAVTPLRAAPAAPGLVCAHFHTYPPPRSTA
jgi:hypothetical protein